MMRARTRSAFSWVIWFSSAAGIRMSQSYSTIGVVSALAPGKDVKPAANITWWHAMSGINGEALNKIVNNFNASQSAIKVTTVFQGTYDDLLSKLNTALASNAAPALVQVYDIGQRYMYDSGQVVPMQAFIDRDKFSTADFEAAGLDYDARFRDFNEQLKLIRRLCNGEQVGTADLKPWPNAVGGPPLMIGSWASGISPRM